MVAHNINGSTTGNIWSFEVGFVPDLIVGDMTVPDEAFSGQSVQISWRVTNQGEGPTSEPIWYDDIYLSSSAVFDNTAIHLGRFRNVSYLGPDEHYVNSQNLSLPDGIEGTYFIHIITDEDNIQHEITVDNNIGSSSQLPVNLTPHAELQVTNIVMPSNVFSGDTITISWTVQNLGTGRTDAEKWFDSIFLSDSDSLDIIFIATGENRIRIQDTFLEKKEHTGALEAGEEYQTSLSVKLPDDAIGEYYIIVYTDIVEF